MAYVHKLRALHFRRSLVAVVKMPDVLARWWFADLFLAATVRIEFSHGTKSVKSRLDSSTSLFDVQLGRSSGSVFATYVFKLDTRTKDIVRIDQKKG